MLEWLKIILGDSYTEEIDQKVSAEIGKGFVSKTDFNAKNEELKTAQGQLLEAKKTIEGFEAMDIDGIKKAPEDWKAKYEQAEKDHAAKLDGLELDGKIESALRDAKAKNAKAVRALLDMEALKASKNRDADIKAAVEAVATENAFLFGDEGGPRLNSGAPHGPGGEPDYSKMTDEEYYAAIMKKE